MRLVRFGVARTGILLEFPTGPHVLDIAASVEALSPEDLPGNGILIEILKNDDALGSLIQHWAKVRVRLRKLVRLASSTPDHSGLVIHPYAELAALPKSTGSGEIVALGVAEDDGGFSYCEESKRNCEIASCVYSVRGDYLG